MAESDKKQSEADEKLVQEAHKRFERCQSSESEFRELFRKDLRFAHGDSDNGYQWDQDVYSARMLDKRPCLTINKTKQHNRQITNQARENKPSVRVSPVDDGADKKTAQIINGIIRHIEVNSNADTAYDTGAEFAVDGGIGYWRVTTDYASDDSFDQEIYIRRVKNPLNVYLDDAIQEADGSDANFGFVFEDIDKDEFKARYPDDDCVGWPLESGTEWLNRDMIRLAEYFYATDETDYLVADEFGNTFRMSTATPEQKAFLQGMPDVRKRKVKKRVIRWCLIAGDQILDRREWPGRYIPIVRVVGEEVDIDGKTERKGHTRDMKDPQRMYNYWSSSATEHVALQNKIPYVGPAEAREGYETYWDNANNRNFSYLPYNHTDDNGNPIPAPVRQQPPVMAQAYMQGMQVAQEEMKMASGQYDASFGANPSTQSGRALNTLQRKGDLANFHFIDNLARAIKYTGRILVDLIPKVYDTPRVLRILGEDGSEEMVKIDPGQAESVVEKRDVTTGDIERIYNPGVGRYDVVVSVGPSYTTRRAEAFEALTNLAQGNPALLDKAGDLIMKAADFPMADELAERLAKLLPPGVKDDGDSPEAAAAKKQIQELQGQLQALGKEYNEAVANNDADREKRLIDRYNAETDRLKLLLPALGPKFAEVLAAEFGIQVINSPDIYPGTDGSAPPEPGMPPNPMQEQPEAPQIAGL